MKIKFAWASSEYKEADSVFVGVPDESGSNAGRRGSVGGPAGVRRVSNERSVFSREGKKLIAQPQSGIFRRKLHDFGDIKKLEVSRTAARILKDGKMPVFVGGDHSITFEVLKGINNIVKDIKVIYFDAHPDFVCSSRFYYGSVMCDVQSLKNVNLKKSLEIGIRAPEKEEVLELKKRKIKTITPIELAEKGVKKIFEEIKKTVGNGKNVYLSIDMDVIDPAFAPGVNTPVPGGLTSNEMFYLCKKIAGLGLIGFDVMETSPSHDVDDATSDLAGKLVVEILTSASLK